jgi:mutator protein MutT
MSIILLSESGARIAEVMRKFVVAIIYNPETGKVLLQRRAKSAKRSAGKWGLFGGKVEEGETEKEAILRELKEELDLEPNKIDFLFVKKFSSDLEFWVYKVELVNTGKSWFEKEEIKNLDLIPYDKVVLSRFFKDI